MGVLSSCNSKIGMVPKSCFQNVCERGHVCIPCIWPLLKTRYCYLVYCILTPRDPIEVVSEKLAPKAKIWRSKRVWTCKAYKARWVTNTKTIDGINLILKGANKILIDVFNFLVLLLILKWHRCIIWLLQLFFFNWKLREEISVYFYFSQCE